MTLENTFETFNKSMRRIFRSRAVRVDALKKRIHKGVTCDQCGRENFEGDRLCCTICDNYNLCSECFCLSGHSCCHDDHSHSDDQESNASTSLTSSSSSSSSASESRRHSIDHPCLLVVHPVENSSSCPMPKLTELVDFYKDHDFNIVCNCCEKKIIGVYFKCNKCYCTYLCYECWEGKKQHACFDPREPHQMIVFKSKRLEKYDYKELKLGCMIGNGNFGYVYEAMLKPVNNFVACKLLDKKFSQQNLLARINNKQENLKEKFASIDKELQAYVEIYSPFICKLFGYGRDRASNLFLVMEYMDNGTLEDLMVREKKGLVQISLRQKLSIMANIACGLADIHSKNLIHADVKPKNILIDSSYTAKICDLGSIKNANNNQFDNQIGGLFYLPLEFYLGKYDEKIDVYSFGLIMYHLFSGKRHSYSMNNALILDAINKVELRFVRSLIECATNFNIVERKSIYYYRNFLKNYLKLFDTVLEEYEIMDEYEELSVPEQNTLLICISDFIVEYIQVNFSIKLDLNGRVGFDSVGFKPELKEKLDRATKSLRRQANVIKFGHESKLKNIESKASLIDFKLTKS